VLSSQVYGAQGISFPSAFFETVAPTHVDPALGMHFPSEQRYPVAHSPSALQDVRQLVASAQLSGAQSRALPATHAPLPSQLLFVSFPASHLEPHAFVDGA
jgi:hypothetical protein